MDLVSLSVRRPVAIGMLVVAMVIFGAVSFTRLSVNLLPEISYPTLTTLQFIAASKRLGTSGVILFSYDALIAPPYTASTLTDIGRAAFGIGSH